MAAPAGYRVSALDIRRLSLFLAVVEHAGFTRAAHAVHMSQPALSQAIAELEAELGGPLFHRLGRTVTLTDAGAALVGPARAVLREIDAARQVTAEVNKLSRGRLDLSALPTLSTDPLPALLGAYRQAYPAVTVHIASPGDPDDLAEQVRTGAAEVGVTDASRSADGLVAVPFRGQQLVAVFPPGSAAPAGPLRPGSLADVPLIVTPPGSSGRGLLEAALGREGLRPLIAIETSQREAILPLVLAGAGAAVMPEAIAVLAAAQGAVTVPLDPPLMRDLAIVHRLGSPTPAAAAFLGGAARLATRPHGDQGLGKGGDAAGRGVEGDRDHEDGEGDGQSLGPDFRGDPAPGDGPGDSGGGERDQQGVPDARVGAEPGQQRRGGVDGDHQQGRAHRRRHAEAEREHKRRDDHEPAAHAEEPRHEPDDRRGDHYADRRHRRGGPRQGSGSWRRVAHRDTATGADAVVIVVIVVVMAAGVAGRVRRSRRPARGCRLGRQGGSGPLAVEHRGRSARHEHGERHEQGVWVDTGRQPAASEGTPRAEDAEHDP